MKNNIEEDIKILKDKAKALNEHIKDYEESNCTGSDVYRAIKEEKEAIENILADRERLEKENKKNTDALELLNKMKKKYKLALFMIIRNSVVMPKGIELQKTSKEINRMSYETLCEVLNMIDFKQAEKMYEEGKIKEEV